MGNIAGKRHGKCCGSEFPENSPSVSFSEEKKLLQGKWGNFQENPLYDSEFKISFHEEKGKHFEEKIWALKFFLLKHNFHSNKNVCCEIKITKMFLKIKLNKGSEKIVHRAISIPVVTKICIRFNCVYQQIPQDFFCAGFWNVSSPNFLFAFRNLSMTTLVNYDLNSANSQRRNVVE